MDRYKKIIIITGIIGAVLICWGFLYSQADRYGLDVPGTRQIFPEKVWRGENRTITYEFGFDFSRDAGRCLHFVSDDISFSNILPYFLRTYNKLFLSLMPLLSIEAVPDL